LSRRIGAELGSSITRPEAWLTRIRVEAVDGNAQPAQAPHRGESGVEQSEHEGGRTAIEASESGSRHLRIREAAERGESRALPLRRSRLHQLATPERGTIRMVPRGPRVRHSAEARYMSSFNGA